LTENELFFIILPKTNTNNDNMYKKFVMFVWFVVEIIKDDI